MLLISIRATVSPTQAQKPRGHPQPWSSEMPAPHAEQARPRTRVIRAMGNSIINNVRRVAVSARRMCETGVLRPSSAARASICCAHASHCAGAAVPLV
jgi:hypothetical protein